MTAPRLALQLPPALQEWENDLAEAFGVEIPGNFPEDQSFVEASQADAIARVLIRALHQHLIAARIAYLFREKMERRGRVRLGVAAKASSKILFLTNIDFVLEFNWTAWRQLTREQRIALVDHELTHCERDLERGVYVMQHHDVEEFTSIVRRWGLWTPDLRRFGEEVTTAQRDLFASTSAADG